MVNFRTKKESASPKSPSGGGRRKRGDAEAAEGGGRGRKGTIWGQAYLATLYGSPEGSPAKTRRDAEARSRMLWSRIRAKLNLRSTEQRRRMALMKALHDKFEKGHLELPVSYRRREVGLHVVSSAELHSASRDKRLLRNSRTATTTMSRGFASLPARHQSAPSRVADEARKGPGWCERDRTRPSFLLCSRGRRRRVSDRRSRRGGSTRAWASSTPWRP